MPDQQHTIGSAPPGRQAANERRPASSSDTAPAERKQAGRVGFIGLGHMGIAMATNLARNGWRVIGLVRRPERREELSRLGLEPSIDISDLFDCPIVITMLPDDRAVRDVVLGRNGLSRGLKRGAVHLSMSTISTAAATEI